MDVVNTLNSVSYNQNIAETLVFGGLAVAILGTILVMYWQTILMGAVGVICLTIIMNHKDGGVSTAQAQPSGMTVPSEHDAYILSCVKSTEYSKEQCEMAWKDTGIDKEKKND
jgi:invasion protein IalB